MFSVLFELRPKGEPWNVYLDNAKRLRPIPIVLMPWHDPRSAEALKKRASLSAALRLR
jgi:hypothetical protein